MDWNEIYHKEGVVQSDIISPLFELKKLLIKNCFKGIKILDAGCGAGRNLMFFQENFPGSEIIGLDNSKNALKLISKKFGGKTIVWDLCKKLPFDDCCFDVVLSVMVAEHHLLEDIKFQINELKRIVRPGGYIVFVAESIRDFRYGTGIKLEENTFIKTPQKDGSLPHHYFTDLEIENLFSDMSVIYKKEQFRFAVMANGRACDWDYIFEKI